MRITIKSGEKAVEQRTDEKQKMLYDGIQNANPPARAGIGASVLLISGCQDKQFSSDGDRNGARSASATTPRRS